jgi:hypothetical protein
MRGVSKCSQPDMRLGTVVSAGAGLAGGRTSGRPIAMAPPLTLVLAGSAPVSCAQALATGGML